MTECFCPFYDISPILKSSVHHLYCHFFAFVRHIYDKLVPSTSFVILLDIFEKWNGSPDCRELEQPFTQEDYLGNGVTGNTALRQRYFRSKNCQNFIILNFPMTRRMRLDTIVKLYAAHGVLEVNAHYEPRRVDTLVAACNCGACRVESRLTGRAWSSSSGTLSIARIQFCDVSASTGGG